MREFFKKFNRITRLRFIQLMRIRDNMERIARGFAWGTFLAIWPSVPFNTILCFLAPLFGGNIMSAIIASWIVGPFFVSPLYYYLSYIAGKYIFKLFDLPVIPMTYEHMHKFISKLTDSPWENLTYFFFTAEGLNLFWRNVRGFFWAMMLGGFILGITGAIIAYKSVWWIREWFVKHKKNILKRKKKKFISDSIQSN